MNCDACDQPLNPKWKFCPECGKTLNSAAQPDEQKKDFEEGHFAPPPEQARDPKSPYGPAVRAQVFEVIVRQAMAGAPWKEICRGPMEVNDITIEEVEAEMQRRRDCLRQS